MKNKTRTQAHIIVLLKLSSVYSNIINAKPLNKKNHKYKNTRSDDKSCKSTTDKKE